MTSTLKVAIVGSGPGGFYAAEALLRLVPACQVDMIERLSTPHGLVRYGVAPDHQKLKQVAAAFDAIARDPRFRLLAGVELGAHVSLDELRGRYHVVVLATGRPVGRELGIPNECLVQVFTSAQFVGWYNGHPDQAALRPDLSGPTAVVIGNGNVSLDVCRLLAEPFDELRVSDIPEPMLRAFECRGVREIHMIGRARVTATKFTFKEFRQLVEHPAVNVCVPQAGHWSDADWSGSASDDAHRVAEWLRANAERHADSAKVNINFWFNVLPTAFSGEHCVSAVSLSGLAGESQPPHVLPCSIAVTCIGFEMDAIAGLPGGGRHDALPHRSGQVLSCQGDEIPGLFATGWAKRGPTGVIGTNRADGYETVQAMLARLPSLTARRLVSEPLDVLLADRGVEPVSYPRWLQIDRWERERGARLGKPREKALSASDVRCALASDPVSQSAA